jgi:hypothetical protein
MVGVFLEGTVGKLSRLWEAASNEDRQGMARSLFEYVIYDIGQQRIVDFRLEPWADRFLVLRVALYEDAETGKQAPAAGFKSRKPIVVRRVLMAAEGQVEGFQTVL